MHPHHDQIGTPVGSLAQDFPMRPALDKRRFHRAVGLRLAGNQLLQPTAHLGDRGRANAVPNRSQWRQALD